jgi:hypothetical protein
VAFFTAHFHSASILDTDACCIMKMTNEQPGVKSLLQDAGLNEK